MDKIQMPSSFVALSTEEQRAACGGSELKDAADSFFGNLRVDDFFYGGGLISFSISFVPMLLFRMIKAGVQTGIMIYDSVSSLLTRFMQNSTSVVLQLDKAQKDARQAVVQTNSPYTLSGLLK